MTGRSVGSDASPLSCFLFRPRKSCERRRKCSHTNVSSTLSTRPSTPPVQTAHVRFRGRKRVHTPPQPLTAHTTAHTAKHGRFGWGWYHYPRSVPHVSETLRGRSLKRQTLPLLGLGRGCSRRTQKACGTAMRLCVSLSRRRRGPAGLRDPVAIVSMIKNMINPWAGSFLTFCWANANSIKKVVLQPF